MKKLDKAPTYDEETQTKVKLVDAAIQKNLEGRIYSYENRADACECTDLTLEDVDRIELRLEQAEE